MLYFPNKEYHVYDFCVVIVTCVCLFSAVQLICYLYVCLLFPAVVQINFFSTDPYLCHRSDNSHWFVVVVLLSILYK